MVPFGFLKEKKAKKKNRIELTTLLFFQFRMKA